MRKSILVDPSMCTGCKLCALICSLTKIGACNPVRSRIRIADWKEKGSVVPILCQDCEEPVCMPSCPEDAITRNQETGAVEIERDLCTNCKTCIKICPYGGPAFDPVAKEVVMCDHCGGNPACVEVCMRDALVYDRVDGANASIRLKGMTEIRRSMVNLGRV